MRVLLLLFLTVSARAAVVQALSDADMLARADVVALCEVVAISTTTSQSGHPYTEATVLVLDGVKGAAPGATLPLVLPGGRRADGAYSRVAGAPALQRGQLWLGFLVRGRDGRYRPWGLGYGLRRADLRGGHVHVTRDVTGITALGSVPTAPPSESLGALKERLRR
jgi:hypothetical protein